jgi:uncharacterized protein (TIGR00251 family)
MNNETRSVTVSIVVVPRAKKNRVVGFYGGRLKIALAAPPVDGRANKALLLFLAEIFSLPKGAIELVAGEGARQKIVKIRGIDQCHIDRCLAQLDL